MAALRSGTDLNATSQTTPSDSASPQVHNVWVSSWPSTMRPRSVSAPRSRAAQPRPPSPPEHPTVRDGGQPDPGRAPTHLAEWACFVGRSCWRHLSAGRRSLRPPRSDAGSGSAPVTVSSRRAPVTRHAFLALLSLTCGWLSAPDRAGPTASTRTGPTETINGLLEHVSGSAQAFASSPTRSRDHHWRPAASDRGCTMDWKSRIRDFGPYRARPFRRRFPSSAIRF